MKQSKLDMIAQANKLTEARYGHTVIEKRALYAIIKQVRKDYIYSEKGQKDLFEDLIVKIDTNTLKGVSDNLDKVYQGLKKLRSRTFDIETEEFFLHVGIIDLFKHKKYEPHINVQVSKHILPYLVALSEQFTEYSLVVAMSLKKPSSQRFYEWCSQYKDTGIFYLEPQEINERFGLNYKEYGQIKLRIIEPAYKELKALYDEGQSDICFKYTEEKEGKKVVRLKISVMSKTKEAKEAKERLKPEDHEFYIRTWLMSWLQGEKKPKNKQWIIDLIKMLQVNPEDLEKCYKILVRTQEKQSHENWAAYARGAITNEFEL